MLKKNIIDNFLSSKPVIGIYANKMTNNNTQDTMAIIYSTYIKWINKAGAVAIAILPWYSKEKIDEILAKVNGILFMGGEIKYDLKKDWELNAKYILDYVINVNNQGIKLPLFATCQGLELVLSLLVNSLSILKPLKAFQKMLQTEFNYSSFEHSILYSNFSRDDILNMETKNLCVNFHKLGIDPDYEKEFPELKNIFNITSFAETEDGKKCVNVLEGKNISVFAVQYHPEKDPIEGFLNDEDKRLSKDLNQKIGDNYVNLAKEHFNKYGTFSQNEVEHLKVLDLILNPPKQIIDDIFCYLYTQETINL